jgi:succinate-semialdehyde dehydrogenase/glutarate-semialdehyde dehydrogenase
VLTLGRRPVGPCYLVTPWNFPLAMVARKLAPALAAGCTSVLKPADLTPLTSMLVVDLLQEAGAPAGVVNLLTTNRPQQVSEAVFADHRLRKLSFTGSTAVGRTLLKAASNGVLRTSMELGGNAPFIVMEGAEVEAAVDCAMTAKFRNVGQACTAANRFLVHESIVEEFGHLFAKRASELSPGPGLSPQSTIGPLISERSIERAVRLIDDAVHRGAKVLTGGHRLDHPGYFLEPTVLTDVSSRSRVVNEEIFAPIAPISAFSSYGEMIDRANATEYGLAAYVCAPTAENGHAVARDLEVGMVGVNAGILSNAAAPFGGVKNSGLGREGGLEGIEEYLALQYVVSRVSTMSAAPGTIQQGHRSSSD